MKIKIKLTIVQFSELINFINISNYENLSELQVLNIRLFLSFALKKLIDCKPDFGMNYSKLKSFSIEVNQYAAVMYLLTEERNELDPYMLSLFITLQNQNRHVFNLN